MVGSLDHPDSGTILVGGNRSRRSIAPSTFAVKPWASCFRTTCSSPICSPGQRRDGAARDRRRAPSPGTSAATSCSRRSERRPRDASPLGTLGRAAPSGRARAGARKPAPPAARRRADRIARLRQQRAGARHARAAARNPRDDGDRRQSRHRRRGTRRSRRAAGRRSGQRLNLSPTASSGGSTRAAFCGNALGLGRPVRAPDQSTRAARVRAQT